MIRSKTPDKSKETSKAGHSAFSEEDLFNGSQEGLNYPGPGPHLPCYKFATDLYHGQSE